MVVGTWWIVDDLDTLGMFLDGLGWRPERIRCGREGGGLSVLLLTFDFLGNLAGRRQDACCLAGTAT